MSVAALNVLESQEKSRSESFNFSGQQQSLEDASSDVSLIKLDLKRIPVAVQEKQAAALNCWVNRKLNIDALKAKGYSPVEAQKEARPNNCASLDREAKSALNTHQETTQGKLSEALALKQKLGAALVSDKDALARANERANALVTPQMLKTSSTLMQELIENDLGARKKYYGSIALIMLIELLPLVMKLISRQTQAGFQIGVNHISQKLRLLEELADARHHHEVFQAVRNASTPVVAKAMESTETQQQLHEVFVKMVLPTVARINAARMVNEQLVTAEEEAHALARKHASLASAVSAVWGNAINETAQMMENRDLAAT
ncbi:hypothetical protein FACS1894154_11340 [Betaproteobacteria bacterium]|nr:hypothetical protein FACS1894154_11340 [Betaproteobacteria bacterium]GHU25384.1 hypothetical protein FACS189488_12300 [Betaproteobacteria bacterium]